MTNEAFYPMYVDFADFEAEGDHMVGDDGAEDDIRFLRSVTFSVRAAALTQVEWWLSDCLCN